MSVGEMVAAFGFMTTAVGNAAITWWRTAENAIAIIKVANEVDNQDKRIAELERSDATKRQWMVDMERRMSESEKRRS